MSKKNKAQFPIPKHRIADAKVKKILLSSLTLKPGMKFLSANYSVAQIKVSSRLLWNYCV